MATLTTIGGVQIAFVARAISGIADHDATTGQAVTCIYGLSDKHVSVRESVPAIMARLKIGNNFAQLTRANGSPVWLNGSAVTLIRPPLPDEYVTGVNTVIFAAALTQGVKEPPDVVTTAINARGGDL